MSGSAWEQNDLSLVSHQVYTAPAIWLKEASAFTCSFSQQLCFSVTPLQPKGNKWWQTAISETLVWYESVVWQVEAVNEALSLTFLSMRDSVSGCVYVHSRSEHPTAFLSLPVVETFTPDH